MARPTARDDSTMFFWFDEVCLLVVQHQQHASLPRERLCFVAIAYYHETRSMTERLAFPHTSTLPLLINTDQLVPYVCFPYNS